MPRRPPTGEAGFMLIELLVALVLALGISSLALDLIPTADSSSRASTAREAATVAAQEAAARMTQDARMATAAAVQSPSVLDLTLAVRNSTTTQHIRYSCSAGACTRTVCQNQSASLIGAGCDDPTGQSQIVSGLADSNVFVPMLASTAVAPPVGIAPGVTATMDHLGINLRLSLTSTHTPVEIDDGTAFANFSL